MKEKIYRLKKANSKNKKLLTESRFVLVRSCEIAFGDAQYSIFVCSLLKRAVLVAKVAKLCCQTEMRQSIIYKKRVFKNVDPASLKNVRSWIVLASGWTYDNIWHECGVLVKKIKKY